ncbi:MAG: LTA synthase family protein, partial [Anaerovorax sp.]
MNEKSSKIKGIFTYINGWFAKFYSQYGLLGLVALLAVPLKLWLFYTLVGVTANFIIVWLITCLLTLLLFNSFKNKWIPAGIFLVFTILLFADVTYCSFFNRYLSVNMLGAAGFLGDITASIKEVLRPVFGALFLDNAVIFGALVYHRVLYKKEAKEEGEKPRVDPFLEFLKSKKETKWQKAWKHAKTFVLNHKTPFLAIFIILILVVNVTGSGLITSVSNQEIITYHVKDIAKSFSSSDHGLKNIASFDKSYEKEKDGPLFGVAKGKNLIVIQVESFQNFVINREYNGQELTPNLNKLLKEQGTLYFDNYYQQIGSGNTSDAEFATNNSLYGSLTSYTYKNCQDNYFKGLPALLKEKGYNTSVFHAYWDTNFWNRANIYPNLGFDTFYGGDHGADKNSFDLTEKMGWGLSDSEFFKQSMNYIKNMPQPFYNFMITLSNHHPFEMPDKYQFIDLLPEDKGTLVGNYLNSAAYTDYTIGAFIQQLKEEGLYDNTVIALYGDHLGLTLKDDEITQSMTRLLGKPYDFQDMMKIPLIIHVPGDAGPASQTISTAGGQLDFMPTMAYLMGFDTLDTLYLGHNLLTIKSGFVTEQTYMTKGSFFQDDIVYEMSRDGVFENGRAYNQKTGEGVPIEECYAGYLKSMDTINASEYILKNDVLRKMLVDGEDAAQVFAERQA